MFFYRQRPDVPGNSRKITTQESRVDQEQMRWRLVAEHGYIHKRLYQRVNVKGGIDFETAPQPERLQVDVAKSFVFLKKQARNQKAAEDKKQVDAAPSHAGPSLGKVGVAAQNQQDGDGAERV